MSKWFKLKSVFSKARTAWCRDDGFTVVWIYRFKNGRFVVYCYRPNGRLAAKEYEAESIGEFFKDKVSAMNYAMKWQKKHRFVR